jgi:hypothetical protein
MKHASSETLRRIEPLLVRMRQLSKIKEKKLGIFYKGAKAFAHFHEDPKGIFADLWVAPNWERFEVNSSAEQEQFLKVARTAQDA